MSTTDKLYKRLMSRPRDFTFAEAKKLLESHGFEESNKGKTSGSRVAFIRRSDQRTFLLHKPHPQSELKLYVIDELISFINEISECEGDENGQ